MYIDANTIITLASFIGALVVLVGWMFTVFKWYTRQQEQDREIAKMKKEQTLLVYGILACLKGLKEQGCNGPVTEAVTKLEKHINMSAHDQI